MKAAYLIIALTILFTNISYAQEITQEKNIDILILSSNYVGGLSTLDATFENKMESEGYALNVDGAHYVDVANGNVDLNKFNMIIMFYPPHAGIAHVEPFLKSAQAIFDFVKKGGGLFIFSDENVNTYIPLNKFLEPIGAAVLPESVVDPSRVFRQDSYHLEYFCTTDNIIPHPITNGVKLLVYPLAQGAEVVRATITMELNDVWDVIIRGTKDAYSISSKDPSIAVEAGKSTYASEPPILAVRDFDKGRVVLFTTRSLNYIHNGYHMVFEGICLDKGDGYRLMVNIINWLSEPSRISGDLGGYIEEKKAEEPQEELSKEFYDSVESVYSTLIEAGARPFIKKISHTPPQTNDYVGIIGIYTLYSDGYATVKQFADKAKSLGYDYIVFTDTFENMDEEKWNKLVADCKENSDENFIAIPGLEITDFRGQTNIVFAIPRWPDRAWFDESGKILENDPGIYFGLNWIPRAYISNKTNMFSPFHNKFYSCLEVFAYYRGNIFINNIVVWYRWCQANEYNIMPITDHRIYAPQELDEVIGYKTHVLTGGINNIPGEFVYHGYGPTSVYISEGPNIKDWSIENGRGGYREELWKLYIDVASDVPLKEVIVYDRTNVYRRFQPDSTTFKTEIAGYHDKQHHFTMVITDSNGKQAFSSALYVNDVRQSTYMCTDLQNTLNGMYNVGKSGERGFFGVQGFYVTGVGGLQPQILVQSSEVLPKSGIEYGYGGWNGSAGHTLAVAERPLEYSSPKLDMIYDSGDCNILDNIHTYTMLPIKGGITAVSEYADSFDRYISFTPRPYSLNPMIVEHSTTFKEDVKLSNRVGPELSVLDIGLRTESFPYYSIINPGTGIVTGNRENLESPLLDTLDKHGLLSAYPDFWGSFAVISLDKELDFKLDKNAFQMGYELPGALIKKGQTFSNDYIVIRGEFGESTEQEFESFYDVYGFDGTPAYSVSLEKGKILDQRFVLKLEAEYYVVKGSITKTNLPNDLGITVTGLCDNWDAGMLEVDDNNFRRVGTFEQTGYIAWNVNNRDRAFVIGNLVTCEDTDIKLSLIEESGKYSIYAHNPKDRGVTVTIRTAPWLKSIVPLFEKKVTIEAGKTRKLDLQ